MNKKKKDIMDHILGAKDDEFAGRTRELDCLIYRTDSDEPDNNSRIRQPEDSWKISKENVSVEIWEGKAKIKLKVSAGKYKNMSMKRIASIAVDAILQELKREE